LFYKFAAATRRAATLKAKNNLAVASGKKIINAKATIQQRYIGKSSELIIGN
jgi:hypothetical protein